MAQVALEVQNSAPPDMITPGAPRVDSSYSEALDTVRFAVVRFSQMQTAVGPIGGDLPWNCGFSEKTARIVFEMK